MIYIKKGYKTETFLKSRYKLPPHSIFGSENPAWKGGKIKRICPICEKKFYVKIFRVKLGREIFCSHKCDAVWRSKNKIGKNSANWKGGLTSLFSKIRNSMEYKLWRKSVFQRDKYTCLICGEVGGDINAHHTESFSELLKKNNIKTLEEAKNCIELWLPEKGITMCILCHKIKHKKGD